MQADVRIEADELAPARVIPREAVVENEGEKIVYVPLSGEEFRRREVKLSGYCGRAALCHGKALYDGREGASIRR
jgi:hypothetical protein